MLLFGKPVSEKIFSETREKIGNSGVIPGLGVVLVGDDPASRIYVGIKEIRSRELGFRFAKTELSSSVGESEVVDAVRSLNADPGIHGIVVQLPLPEGIDADRVITAIDPEKDADGFLGTSGRTPVFPEAMLELAKSAGSAFQGKTGIILANSGRFGRVMTEVLAGEGMHAECLFPGDLADEEGSKAVRSADFVFSAIGRPETLSRGIFKKGAVVIDGGISKKDGKVVGDVSVTGDDADIALSPVPGGVGPVTVACLLRRVATLALENGKTAV